MSELEGRIVWDNLAVTQSNGTAKIAQRRLMFTGQSMECHQTVT